MCLRYVVLIAMVLAAAPAAADKFYVAVKFVCDAKGDFVALHYLSGDDEEDRAMFKRAGDDAVDPWALVETKDNYIVEQKSVTKQCTLSDGTYVVVIGPSPGNFNVQGGCGAHLSAWTTISKDGNALVSTEFEGGDCFDSERPIYTLVLWRAGAKEAEFSEVRHDAFH